MTNNAGLLRYEVTFTKTLGGMTAFDYALDSPLGQVALDGVAEIKADAHVHLAFGVDAAGFFIETGLPGGPEVVLDNIRGEVRGTGRFAFLEVQLPSGTLTFDPDVKVTIDLHDPVIGAAADGLIRLEDFRSSFSSFASVGLVDDPDDGQPDLAIGGTFFVSAFNFDLADLNLNLSWPDLSNIGSGVITPGGRGQELLDFIAVNIDQIVDGIKQVATFVETTTGVDVMAQNIPLLNKTLGEVLNGEAAPLTLAPAAIASVSPITVAGDVKSFGVATVSLNLIRGGVAVGQDVTYTSGGQAVTGHVVDVSAALLTIGFDAAVDQTPDAGTSFSVARGGSLQAQLRGLAGVSRSRSRRYNNCSGTSRS